MSIESRAAKRAEIEQLQAATKRIRTKAAAGGGAPPERPQPKKSDVFGTPHVRRGENHLTSRGYSFVKLAGLVAGNLSPEQCTVEFDMSRKLFENMTQRCPGYRPAHGVKTIMAPFAPEFLVGHDGGQDMVDRSYATEMTQKMWDTTSKIDLDEVSYMTKKGYIPDTQKIGGSNQSWIQQSLGGALVPFPEMGPLIPLLRNRNALMSAGAEVLPLPPQGRLAFPRQKAPTTTYHVGEGTKITQSNVVTDQFTLSAKKIGGLIIANNELIRYGGPIVEQMFRNDLVVSLSLQLDYDMLQAEGSDNVVAGLIGYPGITTFTPTTAASGNNLAKLAPQDIYTFMGQIRAANAIFEGWILHPTLLYSMVGKRASVLATGDNLGLFLFDILRDFNQVKQTSEYRLGGFLATDSANVPTNRIQGSTTTGTTLYGGMWSDYKIGMYGTIEFAQADQGDNLFPQDQTMVRAILSADAGPWHPGAFGVCDVLNTVIGN